jgi:glycosyltransferase involved in cell wall biosynthesis
VDALLLAEGSVDRPRGPVIRALGLARGLSQTHSVTVAARGGTAEGYRSTPYTRSALMRETRAQDAMIAPWIPPYLLAGLVGERPRFIADLYDPLDLELDPEDAGGELMHARRLTMLQVQLADAVLCGSESQRDRVGELLSRSGRRPLPPLAVVPFGLDPPPPAATSRPLRERFPVIGPEDPVVLWWGSLWQWLDPITAIDAIVRLRERVPGIRLVFTAGRSNDAPADELDASSTARAAAQRAGVLGDTVLFLDDWVPFDQRHEYLRDATLGITLHRNDAEADLAARARYLDFLWTRLPCVISSGDPFGTRLRDAGLASLVPPRDAGAVADAIEARLATPPAGAAAEALAEELRWERAVTPLLELLERLPTRGRPGTARRVGLTSAFYAATATRRIIDSARSRRGGRAAPGE